MSRTSVIPDLIDALVTHATARPGLADVMVMDGELVTLDPGYRLMVGVSGPPGSTNPTAAQADQTWPLATATGRDETGSVTCSAYGFTGGNDPQAVRNEIFRIAGEVQSMIRTDILQSVTGLRWTSYTGQTYEQALTEDGAYGLLTFRIEFKARI